jgi:hypothetical protein
MLRTFFLFIKHGWAAWKEAREVYSAIALLLPGILASVPAWLSWDNRGARGLIVFGVMLIWAILFLCLLAYNGYNIERKKSMASSRLNSAPPLSRRSGTHTDSSAASTFNRMPMVDLYIAASNAHIGLTNAIRAEVDAFTADLRQKAADGEINLWGRKRYDTIHRHSHRLSVLEPIPADHWRQYLIHWGQACDFDAGNRIRSWKQGEAINAYFAGSPVRVEYDDLHLDRSQAEAWLQSIEPGRYVHAD